MAISLILETSFLIDLERERLAQSEGSAHRFLERYSDSHLFVTETIAGEIAAGAPTNSRTLWETFLAPFGVLPIDRGVAWQYGRIYRYLRSNGMLIGNNDLWIAATAVTHAYPVVTKDADHYRRVPDLDVLMYDE